MNNIITLTDSELLYIQKAVVLYDTEKRKLVSGYSIQDKEFNRQLVIKLLSSK